MKSRFMSGSVLVAGTAALALLAPGLVRAAPGTGAPAPQASFAKIEHALATHQRPLHGQFGTLSSEQHVRLAPMARAAAPSAQVTDIQSLILPVPQGVIAAGGGVVQDISQLDNTGGFNTSNFRYYHGSDYLSSGVKAAVLQNWALPIAQGSSNSYAFQYLATVYSTANQAAARELDAINHIKNVIGNGIYTCDSSDIANYVAIPQDQVGGTCGAAIDVSGNNTDINGDYVDDFYIVFTDGNVLVEMDFRPKVNDIQDQSELDAFLQNMRIITGIVWRTVSNAVNSAGQTQPPPIAQPTNTSITQQPPPVQPPIKVPPVQVPPTATPTPTPTATPVPQPSVSITAFGLGHVVKGKLKGTRSIKLKEKAYFEVDYEATNAGSNQPQAVLTIKKGKKKVVSGQMGPHTASDGTTFFAAVVTFKNKKLVGTLTAQVTVSVGSASDSASGKFKLKK